MFLSGVCAVATLIAATKMARLVNLFIICFKILSKAKLFRFKWFTQSVTIFTQNEKAALLGAAFQFDQYLSLDDSIFKLRLAPCAAICTNTHGKAFKFVIIAFSIFDDVKSVCSGSCCRLGTSPATAD